jgi:hypothetical protein
MPNGYRVRQVDRFENVGSPAVRTSNHSNAQAKWPCMRSAAAVRSAEELLPVSQSVETNFDATGIPQYEQEWMAREEHV